MQSSSNYNNSVMRIVRGIKHANVILVLCLTLSWQAPGYAANETEQPPELLGREHPLVNRIWDVQAGVFISQAQLLARLPEYEFILLGETHDNRRHHEIQAQVIDSLSQSGRRASVSFEMINDAQGEALRTHDIASVTELIDRLRAVEDKWPYARDYQIVFASVLRAGFPIRPANLTRDTIRRVATQGEAGLPASLREHLARVTFSEQQLRTMREDIVVSHCNALPAEAVQPMVTVQGARDAVMSLSLLQSTAPIKLLIAGAGHVRKDLGVPHYLRSARDDARVLALGMIEVNTELVKPTAYTERWGGAQLPFDYVWFTPRAERADPCVGLRERLHKANTQ